MPDFFFDSSALVKRYVSEIGSGRVLKIYRPSQNIIHISQLALVEVTAALTRRAKTPAFASKYAKTTVRFERHAKNRFTVIKINDLIISEAVALSKKYALRGYDAVQLASALTIERELNEAGFAPLIFLSADEELNAAAQTEGLRIENPNNYP